MNTSLIAMIFQEGGKIITEIIRTRPRKRLTVKEPSLDYSETPISTIDNEIEGEAEKAASIEAGCVPCSIGHLGTCSGLLNEAVRFARKDGIASSEVIDRINICTDELNSLERVDLRPEMIVNLPEWEKRLANKALSESRNTRHSLEGLETIDDLEKAAANIQTARQDIGRNWFRERLEKMPEKEKTELVEKTVEKLGKGE